VSTPLLQHPEIGSPRSAGRRGLGVSVFRYTVVYRVASDEIKMLVVKHGRKRPNHGAWRA
jgi:plasmid stabilization system protein ParE